MCMLPISNDFHDHATQHPRVAENFESDPIYGTFLRCLTDLTTDCRNFRRQEMRRNPTGESLKELRTLHSQKSSELKTMHRNFRQLLRHHLFPQRHKDRFERLIDSASTEVHRLHCADNNNGMWISEVWWRLYSSNHHYRCPEIDNLQWLPSDRRPGLIILELEERVDNIRTVKLELGK